MVTVGVAPMVAVTVVGPEDGLLAVTVATGLMLWISARLARAVLSFSLICSICSCSSCSSPGWGGATVGDGATAGGWAAPGGGPEVIGQLEEEEGRDRTRLASEAAGPPFSHGLLVGSVLIIAGPAPSTLAPPSFASEAARRASRRRVLSVSRLK